MNYKEAFKDKKIAVIGLGPHGEMLADVKFLIRAKAQVTIFDLRSESRVKPLIKDLIDNGLTSIMCGKISPESLSSFDLILLSPDISRRSHFLKSGILSHIPIEYPDTLFFKHAPSVTLIGVMGACGKTTVCHLIYLMLKKTFSEYKDQGLFFVDSESSHGALTHLKKIKKGDVVLVRIPEQLIEYYHALRMSPHVAVITSPTSFELEDTKMAFGLLEFQTHNNFIVAPDEVVDMIKDKTHVNTKAKILRVRPSLIPSEWMQIRKASHDFTNAALALQTVELFKTVKENARDVVSTWNGLKGRIEYVKKNGGVDYYNDGASVTPQATKAAILAISSHHEENRDIILIMGGAYTGYDYRDLFSIIPDHVHTLILLPGSGSVGIRNYIHSMKKVNFLQVFNLEEALKISKEKAQKGMKVLFSPGCDAVGVDVSRKERSEKFIKLLRGI